MITATKEDYLKAIYHLEEEYGRQVKVMEVVHYLKLAKSTVSERVQELVDQKLVKSEKYAPITFTAKGREIAKKLTYKHRIIEVFLHKTLNCNKNEIHDEADKLEHAFSDKTIERLKQFLNNPQVDPHGQQIPV